MSVAAGPLSRQVHVTHYHHKLRTHTHTLCLVRVCVTKKNKNNGCYEWLVLKSDHLYSTTTHFSLFQMVEICKMCVWVSAIVVVVGGWATTRVCVCNPCGNCGRCVRDKWTTFFCFVFFKKKKKEERRNLFLSSQSWCSTCLKTWPATKTTPTQHRQAGNNWKKYDKSFENESFNGRSSLIMILALRKAEWQTERNEVVVGFTCFHWLDPPVNMLNKEKK